MIISNDLNNLEKRFDKLSNLKVGEFGRIISLNITNKVVKRHLLDMGLVRGTIVKIKKVAPMGDPIDIEIRGYELCIRKSDLCLIDVEVIL